MEILFGEKYLINFLNIDILKKQINNIFHKGVVGRGL